MFLFVTALFFLVSLLIPGDFVSHMGLRGEAGEAMREQLGLNRPLWAQYLDWLGALLTLDLGSSFTGAPVWDLIVVALPSTLFVLILGLGLAFVLGGWLGRFTGHRGPSLLSTGLALIGIVFLTAFPPALAYLLDTVVGRSLGRLKQGEVGKLDDTLWLGRELGPSQVLWRMVIVLMTALAAVWLIQVAVRRVTSRRMPRWVMLAATVVVSYLVWRQMGLEAHVLDVGGTMLLLLAGVLLLTFGDVLLITRAAMDDVMLEDFVMTARAKGLPERQVRDTHASRPALLPVLSRFTVSIPYFLTGLIILEAVFAGVGARSDFLPILEQVFGQPGMGTLIFNAVRLQNIPVIVGSMLVVAALTLLLRIALDVAHAALDPRIRFGTVSS
jgi:peptide/nickel transport system permease protein